MKLVKEYFAALRALPTILPRLVFRKRTLEEQLQEVGRQPRGRRRRCPCGLHELTHPPRPAVDTGHAARQPAQGLWGL